MKKIFFYLLFYPSLFFAQNNRAWEINVGSLRQFSYSLESISNDFGEANLFGYHIGVAAHTKYHNKSFNMKYGLRWNVQRGRYYSFLDGDINYQHRAIEIPISIRLNSPHEKFFTEFGISPYYYLGSKTFPSDKGAQTIFRDNKIRLYFIYNNGINYKINSKATFFAQLETQFRVTGIFPEQDPFSFRRHKGLETNLGASFGIRQRFIKE